MTIDELMGYQPQLSGKEIQSAYQQFAEDFAGKPYEIVMSNIRDFIRQYYSCYPALLQMAILCLNHYVFADGPDKQKEILEEIKELCMHIEIHCADRELCSDAMAVRSMVCLALNEPDEVIRNLENSQNPKRLLKQSDGILIQAYQMAGQPERAEECNQYMVFGHLIGLLEDSFALVVFHMQEKEKGIETVERIRQVMEIYDVKQLHPNVFLQFLYLCAQFYCAHGMKEPALQMLKQYAKGSVEFVKKGISLHGDAYFDKLGNYFQRYEMGMAPRDEKTILDSAAMALEHPLFDKIRGLEEFETIRRIFAAYQQERG